MNEAAKAKWKDLRNSIEMRKLDVRIPTAIIDTQKLLEENEVILSKGSKNITVDMLKKLDQNLTKINKSYATVSKEF